MKDRDVTEYWTKRQTEQHCTVSYFTCEQGVYTDVLKGQQLVYDQRRW